MMFPSTKRKQDGRASRPTIFVSYLRATAVRLFSHEGSASMQLVYQTRFTAMKQLSAFCLSVSERCKRIAAALLYSHAEE